MPPEEDAELRPAAKAAGLDFIRLATPTTDARRLPAVLSPEEIRRLLDAVPDLKMRTVLVTAYAAGLRVF